MTGAMATEGRYMPAAVFTKGSGIVVVTMGKVSSSKRGISTKDNGQRAAGREKAKSMIYQDSSILGSFRGGRSMGMVEGSGRIIDSMMACGTVMRCMG